jgi:hypothetical protein
MADQDAIMTDPDLTQDQHSTSQSITQSSRKRRIHLKQKKILAPISLCNIVTDTSIPVPSEDSRIQVTVLYIYPKEIFVGFENIINIVGS